MSIRFAIQCELDRISVPLSLLVLNSLIRYTRRIASVIRPGFIYSSLGRVNRVTHPIQ